MKKTESRLTNEPQCIRCGTCCRADMFAHVTADDIAFWEKRGRYDLIARALDCGIVWAGDRIVTSSGRELDTCEFCTRNGERSTCEIYDVRPAVCRDFVSGSSEICPLHGRYRNEEQRAAKSPSSPIKGVREKLLYCFRQRIK